MGGIKVKSIFWKQNVVVEITSVAAEMKVIYLDYLGTYKKKYCIYGPWQRHGIKLFLTNSNQIW